LTIGLDLRDRGSYYSALHEGGQVVLGQRVSTKAKALG
jgi:hypothetical protein